MKNLTKYLLTFLILIPIAIGTPFIATAQVAINENSSDPDPSAMLDVSSSDKGLLIPRMTTEERDAIEDPSEGLMIFNTEDDCFNYYSGTAWYKDCGRDLETDKTTLSPIAFNSTNQNEAEDVAFDSQGNILIAGKFSTEIEIGDTTLISVGTSDNYLAKYDSDQNVLWARSVGSASGGFEPHITTDQDDNIYISSGFGSSITIGSTTLSPQGSDDVFLAKYNSEGTLQWVIQTDFSIEGGTDGDVVVDEQGDVYLSGYFQGTATFGTSTLNNSSGLDWAFLLKCSSSGIWQWGVQTTNANGASQTEAFDLAIRTDTLYWVGRFNGSTIIGGDTYTGNEGEGFVAKYDTSGNYISSIEVGGTSDYLEAYAIAVDDTGNYYIGGNLSGDFIFGDTSISVNPGEGFFLVKYNANDEAEWVSFQDDDDAFIYDIALDNNNDPIAVGHFRGTFTFDTLSVSSGDARDEIFILKLDKNGNFQWVETGTSNDGSSDEGRGVGVDSNNIIYALGKYRSTISFSDISLTSAGISESLILRLQSEDGAQKVADNSLANSQDGDTDASNELQDLSFDGTNLSISSGNSVDLSSLTFMDTTFVSENGITRSYNNADDFVFGANELDNTSSAQQTKFFFDNAQGAFRAGSVLDKNWDQDSLGFASIGMGINVRATGSNTIALGSETIASGSTSTAIGNSTEASGDFSTALGASSHASGNFSTALGFFTTASGQNATALGQRTEAPSFVETVTGIYNTTYTPNGTSSFDEDDRLFVVGNGENASSRSDALLVYKNGNTEVNGTLTVDPNNDDTGYTFPSNSPSSGEYLGTNSSGELIWTILGGDVGISDERLKKDITVLPNALEKLDSINGYYFYWKESADTTRQVGVTAQEIEEVLPELVNINEEGYRSVDYAYMTAFLIQVNKEQEARINEQQAEIEGLKAQVDKISQLEAMLEALQTQISDNSSSVITNSSDEK